MTQKGFVPPVFSSLFGQLYRIGALKVDYVVLLYERFDAATVQRVLQAGRPPMTPNAPFSQSGEYFVLLYRTDVVLSEQKVENGLGTRTRSRRIQGRNRS